MEGEEDDNHSEGRYSTANTSEDEEDQAQKEEEQEIEQAKMEIAASSRPKKFYSPIDVDPNLLTHIEMAKDSELFDYFVMHIKANPKCSLLCLISMVFEAGLEFARPLALNELFTAADEFSLSGSTASMFKTIGYCVALTIIAIGRAASNYAVSTYIPAGVCYATDERMRLAVRAGDVPCTFRDHLQIGRLFGVFQTDVMAMSNAINAFAKVVEFILRLLAVIVVLFYMHPAMAALTFAFCIILTLFTLFEDNVPRLSHAFSESEKSFLSAIEQTLQLHSLTKILSLRNYVLKKLGGEFDACLHDADKFNESTARYDLKLELLVACSSVAVLVLGSALVAQGDIELPLFMAFFSSAETVVGIVQGAASAAGPLHTAKACLGYYNKVRNLPEERTDDRGFKHTYVRVKRGIRFANVSLAYEPDRFVLRGLNFSIPQGVRCGVVGKSGAGKSSLLKLLSRQYQPVDGLISVDDTPLNELPYVEMIAFMPQDTQLWDTTIAENIFSGYPADVQALHWAARMACIYDDIMAMPEGFNTKVGRNGEKLSGGQRQRIALARTFLRDAPIVILDEPFSSQDTATMNMCVSNLVNVWERNDQSPPRTIIVSTHRLRTLTDFDYILVIDNGQVAEAGFKDDLIAADGILAKLLKQQQNAQISEDGELKLAPSLLEPMYPFAACRTEHLEKIVNRFVPMSFEPDATVVKRGQRVNGAYVVVDGMIIEKEEKGGQLVEIARYGPGDSFLLEGMVDGVRSLTTFVANSASIIGMLDKRLLQSIREADQYAGAALDLVLAPRRKALQPPSNTVSTTNFGAKGTNSKSIATLTSSNNGKKQESNKENSNNNKTSSSSEDVANDEGGMKSTPPFCWCSDAVQREIAGHFEGRVIERGDSLAGWGGEDDEGGMMAVLMLWGEVEIDLIRGGGGWDWNFRDEEEDGSRIETTKFSPGQVVGTLQLLGLRGEWREIRCLSPKAVIAMIDRQRLHALYQLQPLGSSIERSISGFVGAVLSLLSPRSLFSFPSLSPILSAIFPNLATERDLEMKDTLLAGDLLGDGGLGTEWWSDGHFASNFDALQNIAAKTELVTLESFPPAHQEFILRMLYIFSLSSLPAQKSLASEGTPLPPSLSLVVSGTVRLVFSLPSPPQDPAAKSASRQNSFAEMTRAIADIGTVCTPSIGWGEAFGERSLFAALVDNNNNNGNNNNENDDIYARVSSNRTSNFGINQGDISDDLIEVTTSSPVILLSMNASAFQTLCRAAGSAAVQAAAERLKLAIAAKEPSSLSSIALALGLNDRFASLYPLLFSSARVISLRDGESALRTFQDANKLLSSLPPTSPTPNLPPLSSIFSPPSLVVGGVWGELESKKGEEREWGEGLLDEENEGGEEGGRRKKKSHHRHHNNKGDEERTLRILYGAVTSKKRGELLPRGEFVIVGREWESANNLKRVQKIFGGRGGSLAVKINLRPFHPSRIVTAQQRESEMGASYKKIIEERMRLEQDLLNLEITALRLKGGDELAASVTPSHSSIASPIASGMLSGTASGMRHILRGKGKDILGEVLEKGGEEGGGGGGGGGGKKNLRLTKAGQVKTPKGRGGGGGNSDNNSTVSSMGGGVNHCFLFVRKDAEWPEGGRAGEGVEVVDLRGIPVMKAIEIIEQRLAEAERKVDEKRTRTRRIAADIVSARSLLDILNKCLPPRPPSSSSPSKTSSKVTLAISLASSPATISSGNAENNDNTVVSGNVVASVKREENNNNNSKKEGVSFDSSIVESKKNETNPNNNNNNNRSRLLPSASALNLVSHAPTPPTSANVTSLFSSGSSATTHANTSVTASNTHVNSMPFVDSKLSSQSAFSSGFASDPLPLPLPLPVASFPVLSPKEEEELNAVKDKSHEAVSVALSAISRLFQKHWDVLKKSDEEVLPIRSRLALSSSLWKKHGKLDKNTAWELVMAMQKSNDDLRQARARYRESLANLFLLIPVPPSRRAAVLGEGASDALVTVEEVAKLAREEDIIKEAISLSALRTQREEVLSLASRYFQLAHAVASKSNNSHASLMSDPHIANCAECRQRFGRMASNEPPSAHEAELVSMHASLVSLASEYEKSTLDQLIIDGRPLLSILQAHHMQ